MAIYFKFKSTKNFESIAVSGSYISVGYLKDIIRKKKGLVRGRDYDLLVSNAQTGEDYTDEYAMIPKCTSVLLRRIPGPRLASISVDNSFTTDSSTITTADQGESQCNLQQEESEHDDFGEDVYATPIVDTKTKTLVDKDVYATPKLDTKTKALVDINSCSNGSSGVSSGSGGQHGFPRKTPPIGYICHRCKVPGHFIQHCPTNSDPSYNIRKLKPPTTVSSTRPVSALPPEFLCPLCRELMKDAAVTKCCFRSFCNNCIQDYLSTKSACVCGSTKSSVVPNVTVREIINSLLVSMSSSSEKSGSMKAEDAESANHERAKVIPSILSAVIKDEPMDSLDENEGSMIVDGGASEDVKSANNEQLKPSSPALSVRIKEERKASYDANKCDTRIKRRLPNSAAADMPRKAIRDYATEKSAGKYLASSVYSNSCGSQVPKGIDAYTSSSDFSRKRMRLI